MYTHNRFTALWILPGTTRVSGTRRIIQLLTPIVVISHLVPASSIHHDPWHPPCSTYVPDSLFPQPFPKFYLLHFLAWHPPPHTPYTLHSIIVLPPQHMPTPLQPAQPQQ